jgi:hypothetical protein
MTNLSTLYFLVKNEPGTFENVNPSEDIRMMEEIESDLLVRAPDAAVRNILGFASSYTSVPSVLLNEIDVFKN